MKSSRFPPALALFLGLLLSLQTLSELLLPAGAPSLDILFGLGIFVLIGCLGAVWWAAGQWSPRPIPVAIRRPIQHPRRGHLR